MVLKECIFQKFNFSKPKTELLRFSTVKREYTIDINVLTAADPDSIKREGVQGRGGGREGEYNC